MRNLNRIGIVFMTVIVCLLLVFPMILLVHTTCADNASFTECVVPETRATSRVLKPTGNGPHSTYYITINLPRVGYSNVPARIYYPGTSSGVDMSNAPYPGLVFAPGAGGYETSYSSVLSVIASWGYIITIVGTGGPCNQLVVDTQSDVLNYYDAENSNSTSIFYNAIKTSSYGASGHSNGGWAAIAGAIADPRFKGVSPLCAAAGPNYDSGQANTQNLLVPLQLVSGAQDSTFLPSSDAYYAAANPIKSYIKLEGSSHGGPFHLEYTISFFKFWLDGEDEYCTFIYGDEMRQDLVDGALQYTADLGLTATAEASKTSVFEDEEFTFSGAGSISYPDSPNRSIAKYEWDFDYDGIYDWNSTSTAVMEYTYYQKGVYESQFKITDSWGLSATAPISITVNNVKPTAVAGEDLSGDEDEIIIFDGSSSSDSYSDLDSLFYRWDFDDGNVTDWYSSSMTNHSYTNEGNYTVRLFVMDDDEAVDGDTAKVEINNILPNAVMDINKTTVNVNEMIKFNADQSFDTPSDINTLSYSWDFGDSQSGQGIMNSHSYDDEGIYTVSLTVVDDDSAQNTALNTITVLNAAPTCEVVMEDQSIFEDETVRLTGSGTDTPLDLESLQYSWDLGVPDIPPTPWSNTPEFEYTYNEEGKYQAVLSVKDDDFASAEASVWVVVTNLEPEAEISVSSRKVDESEVVKCDASESEDSASDLISLNYSWDFGDGSMKQFGKIRNHEYYKTGKYQLKLTVTDDNGESDSKTKTIEVENIKPTAVITPSTRNTYPESAILFNAYDSSDTLSDRVNLTFSWNFGDAQQGTGEEVIHSYAQPGKYNVILTATDDDGSQASDESVIVINEFPVVKSEDAQEKQSESDLTLWAMGFNIVIVIILVLLLILYLREKPRYREQKPSVQKFVPVESTTAYPPYSLVKLSPTKFHTSSVGYHQSTRTEGEYPPVHGREPRQDPDATIPQESIELQRRTTLYTTGHESLPEITMKPPRLPAAAEKENEDL